MQNAEFRTAYPVYPGYARGPKATGDRCAECHRLIGHGTWAVWLQGTWWHARCLERRLERYEEALVDIQDGIALALVAVKRARKDG